MADSTRGSPLMLPTLATVFALWLAWWIWKFVLVPKMHPDKPRQLPYWIPVVGHVRGMLMDSNRLFTYARQYFGNTREIFSITVMGQELYILTSAGDVSSIYRNSKAFDFNPIIREIFADFGVSSNTMDKMYEPNWDQGKHWMDLMHENFKLQMHPGEKLQELESAFLGNIDRSLTWDKLRGNMVLSTGKSVGHGEKVVSLFRWCYEVLVDSATRSFFGNALYEAAPDLLEDFLIFDTESWKLPLQYPKFAARRMYNAKAKVEAAFERYLALPEAQRTDAIWLVHVIEDGIKSMGIIDKSQTSPILFTLYRLINTNAYRTCFWCLIELLKDQSLCNSIVTETKPAFTPQGNLDMSYLLDKCPLLNSFYEEIVRHTTFPIGTRDVVREVTIGGKVLQPGKRLLMPFQQLHSSPEVFGNNAAEFDPKRFMNNPSLVKSTSYRPFGGGLTYCPGRFLARREIFMFVVLILHRFDISLDAGKNTKFPKMDDSISSGGVMGPRTGEDLIVKVKVAKSGNR